MTKNQDRYPSKIYGMNQNLRMCDKNIIQYKTHQNSIN